MKKRPPHWRSVYWVLLCAVVCAGLVYNVKLMSQQSNLVFSSFLRQSSSLSLQQWTPVGDWTTPPPSNVSTQTPTRNFADDASFPPPTITAADVVILVLGRFDAFETRQVIRETWGKDHDNVYFVVGRLCPLPPHSRQKWTCLPKHSTTKASKADLAVWETQVRGMDNHMLEEQRTHGDLLRVDDVDVYRHLPHKLKSAYAWAVAHTRATWFVKTDDDSVVRVDTLTRYLTTTYNATVPSVIGYIKKKRTVPKHGKWAEFTYSKPVYPKFPIGSAGHVVSRPVAEYVTSHKDKLFNYEGEDVSLGIWLDESPLKVKIKWVTSPHMSNRGNCNDTNLFMIGHNIDTDMMESCFNHMDEINHEVVANAPQQIQNRWNIEHINPRGLDIKDHFDIIVKTVYAVFLRREKVPTFVKHMYNRHLEVWNHFKEPCKFVGSKDWFDAKTPCVKKSTAEDFQQSFSRTLDSIANNGFNSNMSLVPVTSAGFPLNGAHRIAAAIALGLPTMPVQRVEKKSGYHWDHAFFSKKGYEEKYADFAILQWTIHVSNVRTVLFWPEAASNVEKMKHARVMVQQDCGNVLYEKIITVNRNGVASLAFHAYGDQGWLSSKIQQLQTTFIGPDDEKHPIAVLFVSPKSTTHLKTCKAKLRRHFALFNPKSSVHIPDYHDEAVLVAEMVLNPNSVMFLNRHEGGNCHEVSTEVATRLKLPRVDPASFLLPQDIMVDSGAVMSFFGLRNRTDVDLLFKGPIQESILGNRRGILVEAHSFVHNRRVATGRAWGAEHLLHCSVEDFFSDPDYYGYCHGIKYVSLNQLIRYKQRRGEPNKDDKDVESMEGFIVG